MHLLLFDYLAPTVHAANPPFEVDLLCKIKNHFPHSVLESNLVFFTMVVLLQPRNQLGVR